MSQSSLDGAFENAWWASLQGDSWITFQNACLKQRAEESLMFPHVLSHQRSTLSQYYKLLLCRHRRKITLIYWYVYICIIYISFCASNTCELNYSAFSLRTYNHESRKNTKMASHKTWEGFITPLIKFHVNKIRERY